MSSALPPTDPAPAKPDDDPLVGQLLHGKYRLIRRIGVGGFGTVYEAVDERGAKNRVAVKVLRPELASNPALVRAFRAEARRMTRIAHPNIVDWKNFDEDESGRRYFVMELVEGEELDRILQRDGPMPPARAANILRQILDALRAAHHHAEGGTVLHLDLKPRNVFVTPARGDRPETVKVIDFGLGQHLGEEPEDLAPNGSDETVAAARAEAESFNPSTLSFRDAALNDPPGFRRCQGCTPEYASPEQCAHVIGKADVLALDGRSDIYSLGVMAFQMLSGQLPFSPPMMRPDYLRLHMQSQPRTLRSLGAKVPRDLTHFVARCLEKDRDKRFANTSEACAAMERILRPSRLARAIGIGVVAALGAFALGAWIVNQNARESVVLASEAVTLGPARRSVELAVPGPERLEDSTSFRLEYEDGRAVEGASVERAGAALRLTVPEDFAAGRIAPRVRVASTSGRLAFEPFSLVWLGREAWTVQQLRVGDVDLAQLGERAVDPDGLKLAVEIAGALEGDRLDVALVAPSGRETAARFVQENGRRIAQLELSALDLSPGEQTCVLRVRDAALRSDEQPVVFHIVRGAPRSSAPDLLEVLADGTTRRCSAYNQVRQVSPSSILELACEFDRPVKVAWSIRSAGDDAGSDAKRKDVTLEPTRTPRVRIGSLSGLDTRTKWDGRLVCTVDDSAHVVRSSTAVPSAVEFSIPFQYSAEKVEFAVHSPQGSAPLAAGSRVWTSSPTASLVVRQAGTLPAQFEVECGGRVQHFELERGEQEAVFVIPLEGEGDHPAIVRAFRVDPQQKVRADRPDGELSVTLALDTAKPLIEAHEAWQELLIGANAGREAGQWADLAALDSGSPVTSSWSVDSTTGTTSKDGKGVRVLSGELRFEPPKRESIVHMITIVGAATPRLDDGNYVLDARTRDEAGNYGPPIHREFSVHREPPTISFEAPDKGTWRTVEGTRVVQIRASDPNGVESVSAWISTDGLKDLQVPLTLVTAEDTQSVYEGRVDLGDAWSKRHVTVHARATDKSPGKNPVEKLLEVDLPEIVPTFPDVVEHADGRGARLRRVVGNSAAPYAFGGRGDDVERKDARAKGLAVSDDESWNVLFAAGEIGDYYLEEREVSRAQFARFLADPKGYALPAHWPAGSSAPSNARAVVLKAACAVDPDLPVVGVSWEEASAYAHWLDLRLPSWVEMEFAMRGGPLHYRPFPSFAGHAPLAGEINVQALGSDRPWPCGSGADLTPDTRIADLGGNVMEWTATPHHLAGEPRPDDPRRYFEKHGDLLLAPRQPAAPRFWAVGGSFDSPRLSYSRAKAFERTAAEVNVGFRCALAQSAVLEATRNHLLREVRP